MWIGGSSPGAARDVRFEVLAAISVSATARVELARVASPPWAGTLVALKRPMPALLESRSTASRFMDEIGTTAAIHHPNVVRVFAWGEDEQGPYLAVELVQGVSLARLMKSVFETGEQFPERLVVTIGLRVAGGLESAHGLRDERGTLRELVHRDLSAANVLMGFSGEVKIADFGLAKLKDRMSYTTGELPSRSVAHISPEELLRRPVDRRADLFALGVLLFELLAGSPPFDGNDEIEISEAVVAQPAPSLLAISPRTEPSLARLVARLLEKDPGRRPSSAAEVAAELDEWLDVRGHHSEVEGALARFVRRNSVRQMRWFERAVQGEPQVEPRPAVPAADAVLPRNDARALRRSDTESTAIGARRRAGPRAREANAQPAPASEREQLDTLPGDEWDADEVEIPTVANRLDPELRAAYSRAAAAVGRGASGAASAHGPSQQESIEVELSTLPGTKLRAEPSQPTIDPMTNLVISAPKLDIEILRHVERFVEHARELRVRADALRETAAAAERAAKLAESHVSSADEAVRRAREAVELARQGRTTDALSALDEARSRFDGLKRPPGER